MHEKRHEFTLQVQLTSLNFVITSYLQSEDYGMDRLFMFSLLYFKQRTLVGIDIQDKITFGSDPRKYITVTGPSNVSNPINQETTKKKSAAYDEFEQLGDDIDPKLWNELATLSTPATNNKPSGSSRPEPTKKTEGEISRKKPTAEEPKKP